MTDHETVPVPAPETALTAASMSPLLQLAVEKGISPEGLEKLVALHERVMASAAQRAFVEAMARFKSICPPIPRRTVNDQFKVLRNGVSVPRTYASLEDIEVTIRGPLQECGLSFRWGGTRIDKELLTIDCIVAHVGGHSVSSPASVPLESRAGSSAQQKYGAAMTYAQRFSLVAALGLTTCEEDTDGNAEVEYVTPEQVETLEALLDQRPSGARKAFMEYVGVGALEEIPAARFEMLADQLRQKIARDAK